MSLEAFLKTGIQALLKAYESDSTSEKIHLSCGLRSQLMKKILSQFNIYSHIVQFFSDQGTMIKGHRLLEVFNPETRAWELWDPDFRVTYINRNSGRSVDSVFFIFGDKKEIIPKNGEIKGWEATKTAHLRDDFAGAVMFEKMRAASPGNLIIINKNQFDLNKIYSDGSTFKKFASTSLNVPRIILVQ